MYMFWQEKTHKEFYDFSKKNFILLCKIARSRSYREFYVYIQFFVIINTSLCGPGRSVGIATD